MLGVDPGTAPVDTEPEPEEPGGGGGGDGDGQPASIAERIQTLLGQAQTAFDQAETAQAQGNSVRWARKVEEAQGYINEAVRLSEQARPTGASD